MGRILILGLPLTVLLLYVATTKTPFAIATDNNNNSVHPDLHESLPSFKQGQDIPDEQVAAYANYRQISHEDARMLLAVEKELRKNRRSVQDDIGEAFAGISINDDVAGQINLRTTDAETEYEALAEEESDIDHLFEHQVVKYSYADLKDAMISVRSADEIKDEHGYVYSALDERKNAVVVGFENNHERAQKNLRSKIGNEITTVHAEPGQEEHIPSSSLSCTYDSRRHCNPLRGGTALQNSGTNRAQCTLGFNAYDETYTHVPFVVTAGHCHDQNNHSNARIGSFSFRTDEDDVDAVRIEIEEEGWDESYYFYRTSSSQAVHVEDVWRGGEISAGTGIAVSAANSDAYMVGEVRNGNVDAREHNGMIGYDMCTQGGDSGSPLVINTTAIGIHEGDYVDEVNNPDGGCYKMGSYAENVERELNVRIRTSSDNP
jgi:hypothetical protein